MSTCDTQSIRNQRKAVHFEQIWTTSSPLYIFQKAIYLNLCNTLRYVLTLVIFSNYYFFKDIEAYCSTVKYCRKIQYSGLEEKFLSNRFHFVIHRALDETSNRKLVRLKCSNDFIRLSFLHTYICRAPLKNLLKKSFLKYRKMSDECVPDLYTLIGDQSIS